MNMIYRKNRFSPQIKTSASLKLLTTTSALALASCGGGTGGGSFLVPASDSGGGLMDLSGSPAPAAARLSFASRIVDGYVADAQVFPDFDFDGTLDADELPFMVRTDNQGFVNLEIPVGRSYQIVSQGGTDINTGNEISTLVAAAGSAVVSPLTSLSASLAGAGETNTDAKMRELFDLPDGVNVADYDFVEAAKSGTAEGKAAFAKAQQLFTTLNIISELTATDAQTGFNDAVNFVGQQLSTHSGEFDLSNSTNISSLLSQSDFATGETTAAITDNGKSILDVIADAVSGANLIIENTYENADWTSGTNANTLEARAAASITQTDLINSISSLKTGGSKEFVQQFASDFSSAAIQSKAGELALIIKDTLGDIGVSDVKASVDQFDLSYDDAYTPLFKIPLSDLVSNDKDLVAGNNTSLAIDEASIGVFSSDSSKMTISVIEEDGVKKVSVVPLDTNGNGTPYIGSAKFTYTVSSENGEATSYAVVNFKPAIPSISISSVNSETDLNTPVTLREDGDRVNTGTTASPAADNYDSLSIPVSVNVGQIPDGAAASLTLSGLPGAFIIINTSSIGSDKALEIGDTITIDSIEFTISSLNKLDNSTTACELLVSTSDITSALS